MANEAAIDITLRIDKGHLEVSKRASFFADVSLAKAAVPGNVVATTGGVNVSLAGLTVPGLCWLTNLDATNYVTYGIHDGSDFFPLGELFAGEETLVRLARDINAGSNELRLVANTASCNVDVQAFEK